ncbi:hypothetical protein BFJ63_vAg18112 [Fusarium oxysporum f. sp. narcissi]|uniref:HTH CENPB-type domain-containing protein n=1 Tax=Fusarium oxysporum f. sp. narcissi TaxID=451672 RepID=A0A4Q2UX79_FUSOX|nr:hypothetical protein BFJ63_vAg18112 [Fusarium oxysporum f. sp. narcissi]
MNANNLTAAREVIRSRANFANRPHRSSSVGITKPLSIKAATTKYKASSSSIVDPLVKKLENPDSVRPAGRLRSLTGKEGEAIVAFVIWMKKSDFPASKPEIEDATNMLRRRRDTEAKPVGHSWYRRFFEGHPELQKTFFKAVEKSRETWEAGGITDLKNRSEQLAETTRTFKIGASECWNADQAGIRVGCLPERVQCLVVRTRRKTRAQVLDPSNRETVTLVDTDSAAGDTTPPFESSSDLSQR